MTRGVVAALRGAAEDELGATALGCRLCRAELCAVCGLHDENSKFKPTLDGFICDADRSVGLDSTGQWP